MANLKKFDALLIVLPLIMAMAVLSVSGCSSSRNLGVQYSVGDSLWTIPPYPFYFSNWSSSHFFKIGDSLVFDFETGRYDVIQVSRLDWEMCTVWNPIKVFYGGPAIIPLTEPGDLHFICNFSNYCDLGMKITVTVNDSCRKPSPSPSPSPSPASNHSLPKPESPPPVINPTPESPTKSAATTRIIHTNMFGVDYAIRSMIFGGLSLGVCLMVLF